MKIRIFGLAIFLILGLYASAASAYSNLVSFGDSLSDNGNFGRWTNGQVWVEYLANDLGATLDGRALGGAETIGNSGFPDFGLDWQVSQYVGGLGGSTPVDTLFTVMIGGNDFLTSGRNYATVANNAANSLQALIDAGATDIMVLNLPNLGATPRFNGNPAGENAAELLTTNYNAALEAEVDALATANSFVNFFMVDVYSLMEAVTANPSTYGFTDVENYPTNGSYDGYLFYDEIHPTTAGHELVAELAGNSVSAVPIPGAVWLMASGIIGLFGIRRRITL